MKAKTNKKVSVKKPVKKAAKPAPKKQVKKPVAKKKVADKKPSVKKVPVAPVKKEESFRKADIPEFLLKPGFATAMPVTTITPKAPVAPVERPAGTLSFQDFERSNTGILLPSQGNFAPACGR